MSDFSLEAPTNTGDQAAHDDFLKLAGAKQINVAIMRPADHFCNV